MPMRKATSGTPSRYPKPQSPSEPSAATGARAYRAAVRRWRARASTGPMTIAVTGATSNPTSAGSYPSQMLSGLEEDPDAFQKGRNTRAIVSACATQIPSAATNAALPVRVGRCSSSVTTEHYRGQPMPTGSQRAATGVQVLVARMGSCLRGGCDQRGGRVEELPLLHQPPGRHRRRYPTRGRRRHAPARGTATTPRRSASPALTRRPAPPLSSPMGATRAPGRSSLPPQEERRATGGTERGAQRPAPPRKGTGRAHLREIEALERAARLPSPRRRISRGHGWHRPALQPHSRQLTRPRPAGTQSSVIRPEPLPGQPLGTAIRVGCVWLNAVP